MKKLILLLLFLPILCFGQTNTIAPDGGNVVTKDADGNVTITGTLTTAKVIRELDFNAGAVKAPSTGVENAIDYEDYPPAVKYDVGDIVFYDDIYYQVVQTIFNHNGIPPDLPQYYTILESLGAEWITFGIKGAWVFEDEEENTIVTAINFPKDMDLSTAPTIKVCWSSSATSADAVWQVEYLYRQTDEDVTAAAQETLNQTATSSSTANGFTTTEFIGFAIPNANDKTIFLRLTRLGSDVDDNLGNTAELHSIILKYTSDKLGKAL